MAAGADFSEQREAACNHVLNYASPPLPVQMVIKEPPGGQHFSGCSGFLPGALPQSSAVPDGCVAGAGPGLSIRTPRRHPVHVLRAPPSSRLALLSPPSHGGPVAPAGLDPSCSPSPPPPSSVSVQARSALTFSLCYREELGSRGPGIRLTWFETRLCHFLAA